MRSYLQLLHDVTVKGDKRVDRTGVGTVALFGKHLRFNLQKGFPAITTKKLYFESVKAELAWMLSGSRYTDILVDKYDCHIWDKNVNNPKWQNNFNCHGEQDAGRVYGVQWRGWRGYTTATLDDNGLQSKTEHIDQLQQAVTTIIQNPADRRIIVTAWNPGELNEMCLPPCHLYFQFFVRSGRFLDCAVVMRSVDTFLGMPFDIASYALLTHIVAKQTATIPGELYMTFMDTHVYLNHFKQVGIQLSRDPFQMPQLKWHVEFPTIDNFHPDMVELVNYKHHPAIKAEMNDDY